MPSITSLLLPALLASVTLGFEDVVHRLTSPNGTIAADISSSKGELYYSVNINQENVIQNSTLGLVRLDGDFSRNLTLESCTVPRPRTEQYHLLHGKKRYVQNVYAQMECRLINANNDPLHLQLLASDTNFAFRYHFPPGPNITSKYITAENSTFHIVKSEHDYQLLQPYDNPVPKYQTFYQPRNNRTKTPIGAGDWSTGFGLPALFFTKIGSQPFYVHIKESGFDGRYPISHIANYTSDVGFGLGFPDPEDGDGKMGMVWPHSPLPWSTPWRIITIGSSAAPIIEDTSVTDLAAPSKVSVSNFVRPGTSSWSWFSNTKNAQNYTATQEFMQLSTRQGWPYTLLDAQWDHQLNVSGSVVALDTIQSLAARRNVSLWVWMNSAGVNNNASVITKTPKDLLWQRNIRLAAMANLASQGVVGLKVDGIQSDKQEMVQYLIEILEDAANAGLMVIYHNGAPPRGWERTWPNLLSTEGLVASEFYAESKIDHGSRMPENNVNQAFVRYSIGPADYSPGIFSHAGIPLNNSLPTTHAHEVALNVIIETGFRCLPDTPSAYEAGVDPALTEMLGEIPFSWDETRFVAGEPGKFFVVYRRLGNTAYIAGINGETTSISTAEYALSPNWQPAVGQSRNVEIDLADFGLRSYQDAIIIADKENTSSAEVSHVLNVGAEGKLQVHMEPFGGFAIRLEVLP